jgi:hypothetical protein
MPDWRARAEELQEPMYEFSCTWLGAIIYENRAIFFQVGDGVLEYAADKNRLLLPYMVAR